MEILLQQLIPFVQIQKSIIEQEELVAQPNSSKADIRDAKEFISKLEQKFSEKAATTIYFFLDVLEKEKVNKDLGSFLKDILSNLNDLQGASDLTDHEKEKNSCAITLTATKLDKIAKKQQGKSGLRRRVERLSPLIVVVALVVVVFGIRLYSALPTFETIETKEELQAAYATIKKVERYDDWMNAKVRKGGFLKELILWPVEPTDSEILFANEMLGFVTVVHDYAVEQSLLCKTEISGMLESQSVEIQLEYTRFVGDFADESKMAGNAVEIAFAALKKKYGCPE